MDIHTSGIGDKKAGPASHFRNCAPNLAQAETVALLTDSVAQVPLEAAREMGITIVPLTVQIGGKPYRDGVDLDLAELYNRMRNEKILPTTVAPSPGEFTDAMRACLRSGANSLLCITLSSRLSSCYHNACLAAGLLHEADPECRIEVLDSLHAAASEGYVVTTAARAAARGKSMQAVQEAARQAIGRTGLVASFETLEYLARGGRIGKAAYMMGSLINIKPIVMIDTEGTVSPVGKVRGTKAALQTMVDHVAKKVKGRQNLTITILEADAPDQAVWLHEMVRRQLQPLEIQSSVFTPVMGVHTGPGLIGLVYSFE